SWSRALDADVAGLVVGLRVEVEGRTAGHEHVVDGLELIEHVHERCDTGKRARPVEVGEAAVPEAGDDTRERVVADASEQAGGGLEPETKWRYAGSGQRVDGVHERDGGDATGLTGDESADEHEVDDQDVGR